MNINTQTLHFRTEGYLFLPAWNAPSGGQILWSYVMLGILCSIISSRQVHKNRVQELRIIRLEKKTQLKYEVGKPGKIIRTGKGQANKNGERRASQKKEGMELFTRGRTPVCIQFKGTGMIHGIPKLLICPI